MHDDEFTSLLTGLKPASSVALSATESAAARDEALVRVEAGAPLVWFARACVIVRQVMAQKSEFTSDDLWAAGLDKPPEPRALGPVLRQFISAGLIRPTGRFIKTAQVLRHRAPIAVLECCL